MSRMYDCNIIYEEENKLKEKTQDLIGEHRGDITLYGGQSDSEYAEELVKKLWEAEGCYVNFTINMTYLEDLPYEEYEYSEDEYADIMELYPEDEDDE